MGKTQDTEYISNINAINGAQFSLPVVLTDFLLDRWTQNKYVVYRYGIERKQSKDRVTAKCEQSEQSETRVTAECEQSEQSETELGQSDSRVWAVRAEWDKRGPECQQSEQSETSRVCQQSEQSETRVRAEWQQSVSSQSRVRPELGQSDSRVWAVRAEWDQS